MYAACNTTQNDVLNAVREMVKRGYKYPIIQVGQKPYKKADKANNEGNGGPGMALTNRKYRHVASLSARTLHKKDCRITKRKGVKNLVNASIVNTNTTGLRLCKVCTP